MTIELNDAMFWQGLLAIVLPLLISGLKNTLPSLQGRAAFWVNLILQFLAGVAAYMAGGNPANMLIGFQGAATSTLLYQGQKATQRKSKEWPI